MAACKTPARSRKWFRSLLIALLCSGGINASVTPVIAQQDQWTMTNASVELQPGIERQSIDMVINTSREITANQSFKRVRIQNPNVLTAIPLEGGNRLQVSALATGVTQIDLLGADDSVHSIEVMVLGDSRELEAILRRHFTDANLIVTPIQGGCIVAGHVNSDEHVEQVVSIAQQYFPVVINKVDVTGVHTVQLEVQVMEVSRTKLRSLGIDWAFANGDDVISSTVSGIVTTTGNNFATTGTETLRFGVIENSSNFFNAIQALRQNSLVKVLAEPKLIAIDGRPASFNSGGEIPIVVPAGLGQVGIQYREFGTRLDFVAKVRGNGQIYLEVRPYVSEIDPSRSVSIQGVSVPGLRSRYLETGVVLGAGQTLALGGLLQLKTENINVGVPFLSDTPFIGSLFRRVREEQNEVEMLITVTPNFAGPMDPCEIPPLAPGLATTTPSDKELYMRGYVEVPTTGNGPAGCEVGPSGLIESYDMQHSPGMMYESYPASGGFPSGGTHAPALPVPNPAAMSVGPDAPRLAQQSMPQVPQAQPRGAASNINTPGQQLSNSQPSRGDDGILRERSPSSPVYR